MFSIPIEVWGHIRSLKPAFLSRHPHFNFITVHYFWLIGMIFFCSICLYARSDLDYTDALFLASGAATQSGLNTIDINLLNTWQQAMILVTTLVTTPIAINTYVVFLRLYWFERRFQDVVKRAKMNRRTIARSFSKTKTEERDIGLEESGVQGRPIFVVHNGTPANGKTNDGTLAGNSNEHDAQHNRDTVSGDNAKYDSSDSNEESLKPISSTYTPQIKFADQVTGSDGMNDEELRVPTQRTQEEHIAFLQRQRNPESDILRIPGPRDADAGATPHFVDEADANLSRIMSGDTSAIASRRGSDISHLGDAAPIPVRRNITIQEPEPRSQVEHLTQDAAAMKYALGGPLTPLRRRTDGLFSGEKTSLGEDNLHPNRGRKRAGTFTSLKRVLSANKQDYGTPYLTWEPTVGRNSEFTDLSEEQREELGGIEYRALKTLALILVLYYLGFFTLGVISLVPWIMQSDTYGPVVKEDGQGRPWWGIFTATSAFTDLGFTLTPDSMISFQSAIWPLLLMSFLIIIGNTGFPIMLRFIIWVSSHIVPSSGLFEELRFLLDHPRRCFTLLFPSRATWWLFWILVLLNGVDLMFFIILDLGNTVVTQLPVNIRVLDGWFQAVSTRTAGFAVVNLAVLHPAIQVSYLVMMYISILPIAISVRRTNVYEEKSLGIYGSAAEEHNDEGEPSYVGAHLRRQLSFDLWYIFLGLFIISIAEGGKLQSGDDSFTMFSVLFEIVSAYGTVGLSLGYTNTDTSLSAQFNVLSKLVIIAMQIRGRHRGLPYELDKAILLPSEHLQEQEAEAARLKRSNTLGMAGVSSGAMKTASLRGRSRSRQGKAANVLGNLLHMGPPIPDSVRIDPNTLRRRHSISIAEMNRGRRARSASLTSAPDFGISSADGTAENGHATEHGLAPEGRTPVRRSGSRFSGRPSFPHEASVPEAPNED
ncbi:cation transport protein-domain-containing protein [Bisporella sp. PMI_857]|nr:cation transport protein-domain-containing protein [Bisporella sp. PMI_857]